jgi:hypothetical protein
MLVVGKEALAEEIKMSGGLKVVAEVMIMITNVV